MFDTLENFFAPQKGGKTYQMVTRAAEACQLGNMHP